MLRKSKLALIKFNIALEQIGNNFSIHSHVPIEHFTDLNGYIEKIVINFQNKRFALFLVETNNDVQVRLFDTEHPEKYYTKERWIPGNALRSNKPYILNWKCLYTNPKESSWCDIQIPLHSISPKAEEVLFKMYATVKDIDKALLKSL